MRRDNLHGGVWRLGPEEGTYLLDEFADDVGDLLRGQVVVIAGEARDLVGGLLVKEAYLGEHAPEVLLNHQFARLGRRSSMLLLLLHLRSQSES